MKESKRSYFERIRKTLEKERDSFTTHWQELADNFMPRRIRLTSQDRNKGEKRNQKLYDSTPVQAVNTLRAGMMSGITSPARDWFNLTVNRPDLQNNVRIKKWLFDITKTARDVLIRSNFYNVCPIIYSETSVFGTGCVFVEPDKEDLIRFYPVPVGSFALGLNHRLKVDKFTRVFQMSVDEIVTKFGMKENGEIDWSNISQAVKDQFTTGNFGQYHDVVHLILPNTMHNEKSFRAKDKKFCSVYYELSGDDKKLLRESGYDYFPVLTPRWEVTGEDIYGTNCPGMAALGDAKQLQVSESRRNEAIEKTVRPPMVANSSIIASNLKMIPGETNYLAGYTGEQIKPLIGYNFPIKDLYESQVMIRERINSAFHRDLFLMISNDTRVRTATEINERREEKLLALGPVLEQFNQDFLEPLIDIVFFEMVEAGMVIEAPDEIKGEKLKVEYLSIMAQAQKLVGLSALERYTGYLQGIMAVFPDAAVKAKPEKLLEIYATDIGLDPAIHRSEEELEAIRAQQAQMAQAQMQMQALESQAKSAKTLSETDVESPSALSMIMGGAA